MNTIHQTSTRAGHYVKAVLSSQIEGTQASLMDVLEFDAAARQAATQDAGDVFNYVAAMTYGLGRLRTLPLSPRLIREIHAKLLTNVRGAKDAGEFRPPPSSCFGISHRVISRAAHPTSP